MQSVKRFLHDNAVTAITVMIFVVILGMLLSDRYLSLYSIRNIANTNPLITTDSAELVAVNVNGVIRIIKDEDGVTLGGTDKSGGTPKNPTTNKPSGSNGGGSGGNGSTGGSSGGGSSSPSPAPTSSPSSSPAPSSSPSPTPTPPPPATPLSATVSSLQRTNRRVHGKSGLLFVTCKNDHTIRAQIQITGGSGNAKLQWRFNNTTVRTDDLGFVSTGDVRTSEIMITTSAIGSYPLTVNVLNSSSFVIGTRTVNFNHSCSD